MNAGPPHPARYLVQTETPTALTRSQCHQELIPLDLDAKPTAATENNATQPGAYVPRWARGATGRETWAPPGRPLSISGHLSRLPGAASVIFAGFLSISARESFQNRGALGAQDPAGTAPAAYPPSTYIDAVTSGAEQGPTATCSNTRFPSAATMPSGTGRRLH
jgi:hypothetical protein